MLLAIDIGNTTICCAVMNKMRVVKKYRCLTARDIRQLQTAVSKMLRQIHRDQPNITDVVICSVVPFAEKIVITKVAEVLSFRAYVVGRDVQVPMKNKYRDPKAVGQDRLVCAYAAATLYGAPAIVIDLGTAITFDVVSSSGAYEGGIIVPGIRLSAAALKEHTALLPSVDIIKAPAALIGKDTTGSILSGIFFGYGALTSGLITRLSAKLKKKPTIVLTGGYAKILRRYLDVPVDILDDDLVFKGIARVVSSAISSR